jgi:CheY-like chemotaxis protein
MPYILVVEDHDDSARILTSLLTRCGHAATRVADGKQALAAVIQGVPDVIVLDVHLPEMDGVEFLRVLRGHPQWQSIPVILLTAADDETIRRAITHGVFRVFRKGGFELPVLLSAIAEASVLMSVIAEANKHRQSDETPSD